MNSRVMQVFYGQDLLPYKDKERTIHYPITGGAIAGANKINVIKFYVDEIGGTETISWVIVSKLPSGKIGYEPLSDVGTDTELGEKFLYFNLSSYYTQEQGNLFLALRGYQGDITFTQNANGVYEISGDPLIEVTGTIKLPINYSPMLNTGTQVLPTDVDKLIASLSEYLKIGNGIVVLANTSASITSYDNGQLFYVLDSKAFYKKTSGSLVAYNPFNSLTLNSVSVGTINDLQGINFDEGAKISNQSDYFTLELNNGGKIEFNAYDGLLSLTLGNTSITLSTSKAFYNGKEISDKNYVDDQIQAVLDSMIRVFYYRGSKTVAQINAMSSSVLAIGDVYNVEDSGTLTAGNVQVLAGDNVVWNGTAWDKLAGTIDLSGYVQKTQTIAGIDLQDNITAQELTDALVYATNSDIESIMED